MVFGAVDVDVIVVNEESLWSGGPGKNPDYDGGHAGTPEENHNALQRVRNALQAKMSAFTAKHAARINKAGTVVATNYAPEDAALRADIQHLMGDPKDFGSYQQLSSIYMGYDPAVKASYTDYSRELDIDRAVLKTSYRREGVAHERTYFVSHPDQVMVIRLTADSPGSITRAFWLTSPQDSIRVHARDNVITLEGKPADHGDDGLKFVQQLMVIPTGGTMHADADKIRVVGADEVVLVTAAATNYQQSMDDRFDYFSDVDPRATVERRLAAAARKPYEGLLETHVQDYKSLYDRMAVSLGEAANPNDKPTDQLLEGYKKGSNTAEENRYLEQLYYQFGRYLLIASSRKGSLPANLQGIWAAGLTPPWNADYHTNINVQMNYWPAQQTNLAECHLPVIEYTRSLVPRGIFTAQHYYRAQDGSPVRGWVIHHENNIWGNTAPGTWYEGFYFPAAAAWMCQDIWEYYQFNQDKRFLANYYPVMVDAALFWVDNLWEDARDGTLVANPSYSPEHGPYSLGASADQAIIWELFDMVLKASEALEARAPELEEIRVAKERLAGPRVGLAGQFMEWKDELLMDITGDNGHRHVNHLHWLHPGSKIVVGRSPGEDRYAEAMRTTLNTRGDGGTGWSKAWKINFWARLHDGNRSHKMVQEILKESTLPNLFDTHPPFQIDGNFGSTAGMTEMLLQSHGGYIEVLPSLPDAWASGSFKGIKARGNFEVDATWSDGMITGLTIVSHSGNECVVKYNGRMFSFPTTAGTTYDLSDKLKQLAEE
jgi:alpha-L-fucosidase 2